MGGQSTTDGMIGQLRDYFAQELPASDADFCFRWLACCALFPVLRWPLTSRLGAALAAGDERDSPDEDLFVVLARLPWFRTGRMPQALREELAATLDRSDRRTARAALAEALHGALGDPAAIDRIPPRRLRGHLARIVGRLPPGELSDPLLAAGLRGWRAGGMAARIAALATGLPRSARRLLEAPSLAVAAALAAAIMASVLLLTKVENWFPRRNVSQPATVDLVNLWVSACVKRFDLQEGWGNPAFTAGPVQLVTPLRLQQVSGSSSTEPMLLAPDLSVALTQGRASRVTLWSLQGDGARSFPWDGYEVKGVVRDLDGAIRIGADPRERVLVPGQATGGILEGPMLDAPDSVRFLSAQGQSLVARMEGETVLVLLEGTRTPIARFQAEGSPLLGIALTQDGRLAVARCDPRGKVVRIVLPTPPPADRPPVPGDTGAGRGSDPATRPPGELPPGDKSEPPPPETPVQNTVEPPPEVPVQEKALSEAATAARAAWWADHRHRYQSDSDADSAFRRLLGDATSSPWPDWQTPQETLLKPGTRFQMPISEGQTPDRPGSFGTFDRITDVRFARYSMAVRSDWKPRIERVVTYEVVKDLPARLGTTGPQIDPVLEAYLPGGASQLQFLVEMGTLRSYLRVVEVRRIK